MKEEYDFWAGVDSASKNMDKIRKKYKDHKFTAKELFGYD
jgi:hypothetical protein